jgi:hypothetical protein
MSIAQVLRELPGFSVSDRQLLIREAESRGERF